MRDGAFAAALEAGGKLRFETAVAEALAFAGELIDEKTAPARRDARTGHWKATELATTSYWSRWSWPTGGDHRPTRRLGAVHWPSADRPALSHGFGSLNNWVIHKISDAGVVSSLKRSVSGIDDSLWDRLPSLAPGQAIVSCAHMQRPVLTSIDPTPAKLRMVE